MRYAHLYNAIHCEPWLITDAYHAALAQVLDSKLAGKITEWQEEAPKAESGAPLIPGASQFAPATLDSNGIATISINGVIAKGATAIEKACYGGTGPEDITASFLAASADPSVRGIIAILDSPGGTVGGVRETANVIASIQADGKKPVFAFTDGLLASAAYWLASGSSRIYAAPLANIGSIGVYVPWVDSSARAAMQGLKVDVIKDGIHKGAGYPGTSITEEQRSMLQSQVNEIGAAFRAHVTAWRPRVPAEAMQGQSFHGIQAAKQGLIDGIVENLEQVKAKMLDLVQAG